MSDAHAASPSASADLLQRLRRGDEDAAAAVFERYAQRLTRLARTRLAAKLASRIDPEDVVLSAYRSFFVAARQGRFDVERGGDLWRLLVEVTLHKLYRQAEHHLARRRSVEREEAAGKSAGIDVAFVEKDPTPDEAVAAADELEATLRQLSDEGRSIVELRLQGYELMEIAERLGCSERTVRRRLNEARRLFASRGGSNFVPSAARARPARGRSPATEGPNNAAAIDAPLVWGDYVLQEQIGAGATGRVYRALDHKNSRPVALKFLRKSLLDSTTAIERFLSEARTVSDLAHPRIVAIHGAGRTPGGGLFLVMDLVCGTDLQRVANDRRITASEAARWTSEAASVVHFAHEHGIVHCDLKPSNLLLDDRGAIRVTDFGLAVRLSELSSDGPPLAGTPSFMAPEQVDACWGAISPRTDVWGLGAVLYFLLFGQPPNAGGDMPSVLGSIVSKTPVEFPADSAANVPASLLQILRRCLAKPPADRIESAQDLADALAAALPLP
jgi:eukaryotic-like serine/threonine-protein kinase